MDAALLDRPDVVTPREDPSLNQRVRELEITSRDLLNLDVEHKAGHHRLRGELQKLVLDHETVKAEVGRLSTFAAAAPDFSRVTTTPRIVISIIGGCVAMAATVMGATYGLRTDQQLILARLDAQTKIDAEHEKRVDERAADMTRMINELRQRVDLQSIQFQTFKDNVFEQTRRR